MRSKDNEQILIDGFRMYVLEQAESERGSRRFQERLQHTAKALEEVTGMAPDKIDAIADRVKREYAAGSDRFFSIPVQLAWVAIPVLLTAISVWLAFADLLF